MIMGAAMTANADTVKGAVNAYVRSFVVRDKAAFLAAFADDGMQVDPVGTPPYQGKDRLGQFFDGVMNAFDRLEFATDALYVCGNEAALVFTIAGFKGGAQVATLKGVDVFEVNDAGLLQIVHGYHA
jgi:steroid delta-isomerase